LFLVAFILSAAQIPLHSVKTNGVAVALQFVEQVGVADFRICEWLI